MAAWRYARRTWPRPTTAEAPHVDPERGLSSAESRSASRAGKSTTCPPLPHGRQIVRANVFTRFNAILGAMLAIILVVGPLQDALFGIVLIANAGIGIVQELRAKRTLDRLTLLTAPKARVVRDGDLHEVAVGDVVLDDVLDVGAGSEIVVDGEVLASRGLEVDESLLTGESDAVEKSPADEVLSGSFVAAGAEAVPRHKVGAEAYAVQLAEDARRFTLTRSELRSGIDDPHVRDVGDRADRGAAVLQSDPGSGDWREAMSGAVAGTVAMVPEGLVLLTSLAFAVAVVRLAQRKVLVQELPAVEGLARIDVLCIDKTGTLTEGSSRYRRSSRSTATRPASRRCSPLWPLRIPRPTPRRTRSRSASPSPRDGGPPLECRSRRRGSGAPRRSRGRCMVPRRPDVMLTAVDGADELRDRVRVLADQGHRVLLVAHAQALTDERLPADLEPAGLVVLGDRPRPDAADTLRYFRDQDVTVKVISGDDPRTVRGDRRPARARGRRRADRRTRATPRRGRAGRGARVALVFGRVTPQQKRSMVQALQSRGHTVAMTGDGVNDALALKDADIGVAMGSGSDATRAVAQLVLLDSTFDSLPPVVAEGRPGAREHRTHERALPEQDRVRDADLLATGVLGFVFPFLPRHLTLIGAVTIGIPSFFLALAPNTDRFRPGFVRRVLRFAIPTGTLASIATLLAYGLAREEPGVTLMEAQTTAVMVLTWIGLLVLTILSAPLTRARLALIWTMAGMFIVALTWGPTETFFALDPPPLIVWLAGFGIAAIVWSFARLFVPGEAPVGPRARDVLIAGGTTDGSRDKSSRLD